MRGRVGAAVARAHERGLHRRRDEGREVDAAHGRVGVLARDDLALLGHAQLAANAALRLRRARRDSSGRRARPDGCRRARGTAAGARRAARTPRRAAALGLLVQLPVSEVRKPPSLLLSEQPSSSTSLQVAPALEKLPVVRQRKERTHDAAAGAQILDSLEERDDVDRRARLLPGHEQARLLQQERDLEDVARPRRVIEMTRKLKTRAPQGRSARGAPRRSAASRATRRVSGAVCVTCGGDEAGAPARARARASPGAPSSSSLVVDVDARGARQ